VLKLKDLNTTQFVMEASCVCAYCCMLWC